MSVAIGDTENWVRNGEADDVMAPWDAGGWTIQQALNSPSLPPPDIHTGRFYFAADAPSATMRQLVAVPSGDLTEIDAGTLKVAIHVNLGGSGDPAVGAKLLVQPMDANGVALGTETQVGPPTVHDRSGPAFISCYGEFVAPIGMRSVYVRVMATGPTDPNSRSFADEIFVGTGPLLNDFDYQQDAEAPGCARNPAPTPTPTTTPSPTPSPTLSPTASPTATPTAPPAARLAVSHVALRHRRLSFRVDAGAETKIRITHRDQIVRHLTATRTDGPRVTRRIARLPNGRYRIAFLPGRNTLGPGHRVRRRLR